MGSHEFGDLRALSSFVFALALVGEYSAPRPTSAFSQFLCSLFVASQLISASAVQLDSDLRLNLNLSPHSKQHTPTRLRSPTALLLTHSHKNHIQN
ncbi:hypothetical protein CERSUDRAFT_96350 [Gelatoporia subvermispora B]|uniref:Uncharacterized protein n=1 Tax=Ceriporiopsis subvermispora (strain B) TaxID=914234 RepID=M2PIW9_CERS8|nr:hypothetical protein CERSUDRAFT_96350 [Gelatoporia subvermispora B]